MTLAIAFGVVLVCLLVWYVNYWLNKPLVHQISGVDSLNDFFCSLLLKCTPGTILFVTHVETGFFLQFVKYYRDDEEAVMHFGFPDAPWSWEAFVKLEDLLKAKQVKFEIQRTGEKEPVRAFINIFELGIEEAVQVTNLAIQAMDLSTSDNYSVHYEGGIAEDGHAKAIAYILENINRNDQDEKH